MIIGYSKILNLFSHYEEAAFQHAYILVGKESVGKRTLARFVSAKLLNVREDKLDQHSDFLYIKRGINQKTEKEKKDFTIEQARFIKTKLQNSSWTKGFLVIIIDEAEFLNEEASNALLKILEEPPEKSIIFLLTPDEDLLLPTIRSRAQSIYFPLLSTEVISDALLKIGCSKEKAELIAAASWGRVGRAFNFFREEELFAIYQKEVQRFHTLLQLPFYQKLKNLENLFPKGESEDHIKKRSELSNILEIWEMEWRIILLNSKSKLGSEIKHIVSIIDQLQEAQKLLQQNIHPKLLIENILLNF